jgi:hypothetical protein
MACEDDFLGVATIEGEVGKGASLDHCARDGREEEGVWRVLYYTYIAAG